MPNKHRRSKAQWSELIREYRESGETEDLFCRRHDLNIQTFRGWKYRHGSTSIPRPKKTASRSDFVQVMTAPRIDEPLRIRCGSELSIDCPRDMAIDDIARLASALRDGR